MPFVDDRKQGEGQNQVLKDTERLKRLGTLTGNLATLYLSALAYGPQKQTGQALGVEVLIKSFSRGEGLWVTQVQCG